MWIEENEKSINAIYVKWIVYVLDDKSKQNRE